VDVGALLHLAAGANPHRWYYPRDVRAVIDAITADYQRVDPADSGYFAARRSWLLRFGFARYDRLRRAIRAAYGGTPVGYSESIFQGLGEDLGLRLLTPFGFVKAIAEGTDVTAGERTTVAEQVTRHHIAVWVFNSQNVTPDVAAVNRLVRAANVPVTSVTETLAPAAASFEQWQVGELEALQAALRRAHGSVR
jgi:zinc/manganese transport system substrate-binding protein